MTRLRTTKKPDLRNRMHHRRNGLLQASLSVVLVALAHQVPRIWMSCGVTSIASWAACLVHPVQRAVAVAQVVPVAVVAFSPT